MTVNKLITLIFLLSLAAFYGCKKEDIIEENTFVKFYSDLTLASDSIGYDSKSLLEIRSSLHNKYKTTERLYFNTIEYYRKDTEKWGKFLDKVILKLEKDRQKITSNP